MGVRIPARQRVGEQFRPALKVGLLGWFLALGHDLGTSRLTYERNQAFPQAHPNRLKVFGLIARVVRLECLLPPSP